MTIIDRAKHKFAKWLWRNNQWAKAVDEIESAVDRLRSSEVTEVKLKWHFKFLSTPPANKFTVVIRLKGK